MGGEAVRRVLEMIHDVAGCGIGTVYVSWVYPSLAQLRCRPSHTPTTNPISNKWNGPGCHLIEFEFGCGLFDHILKYKVCIDGSSRAELGNGTGEPIEADYTQSKALHSPV